MSVPFRFIPNWQKKRLACACCGETRSVKYEMHGKTYCTGCILSVSSQVIDETAAYGNDCPNGKCDM